MAEIFEMSLCIQIYFLSYNNVNSQTQGARQPTLSEQWVLLVFSTIKFTMTSRTCWGCLSIRQESQEKFTDCCVKILGQDQKVREKKTCENAVTAFNKMTSQMTSLNLWESSDFLWIEAAQNKSLPVSLSYFWFKRFEWILNCQNFEKETISVCLIFQIYDQFFDW